MEPYVTFVVSARNDNYGGGFLHRIQVFVNALLLLWKKHRLDGELILVEWNPPSDRPRLKDTLKWPSGLEVGTVRVIEVPGEFHKPLPNSDKMPMFEYAAKNVGIRRAKGEYVLATNSDLIFSDELIGWLASRPLKPECFYRVDRYDVDAKVPMEWPVEKQLAFCARHTIRINRMSGTVPVRRRLADYMNKRTLREALSKAKKILLPPPEPQGAVHIHGNASGDFLLFRKDHWHHLRGYPDLHVQAHIDTYGCLLAASLGLQQVVLEGRRRIYHQEHDRTEQRSRPQIDFEKVWQHGLRMLATGKPEILNDENWGLGRERLSEAWPTSQTTDYRNT